MNGFRSRGRVGCDSGHIDLPRVIASLETLCLKDESRQLADVSEAPVFVLYRGRTRRSNGIICQ